MRKELIEEYVSKLTKSFGTIRMPVDGNELQKLYDAQDYARMMACIKRTLKLELKVVTALVNSGGPDAPAWMEGPNPFPLYGSSEFLRSKVTIYIRKSFLNQVGFETLVLAMAHELCHVVLESTYHELRRQEEAVDLTAMLLGFRDFYVTGHISSRHSLPPESRSTAGVYQMTSVILNGYLTSEEIHYAARIMTFP